MLYRVRDPGAVTVPSVADIRFCTRCNATTPRCSAATQERSIQSDRHTAVDLIACRHLWLVPINIHQQHPQKCHAPRQPLQPCSCAALLSCRYHVLMVSTRCTRCASCHSSLHWLCRSCVPHGSSMSLPVARVTRLCCSPRTCLQGCRLYVSPGSNCALWMHGYLS
jgi:hypothetical protein